PAALFKDDFQDEGLNRFGPGTESFAHLSAVCQRAGCEARGEQVRRPRETPGARVNPACSGAAPCAALSAELQLRAIAMRPSSAELELRAPMGDANSICLWLAFRKTPAAMSKTKKFAAYPRLNPLAVGKDISAADLIDQTFLAFNGGRLREAAKLLVEKMLPDDGYIA